MAGRAHGAAASGGRSELAALRAEFNRLVKLHVDAPARQHGYRKQGLHWTKETDEIRRLMGVHWESERRSINFGIDTVVTVKGTEVFNRGEGLVMVPLGRSDGFIQAPTFAGAYLWWYVDADGLSGRALDRFPTLEWAGSRVPLDGKDLESVVRKLVLPFLEQFSTTADARAYARAVAAHWGPAAAARNVPPHMREPPGVFEPLLAIEAMAAWRDAGSPITPVTVSRLDDDRVRVEVDDPTSLVGNEDDDLVYACVERGTPREYAWTITEVERLTDRVLIVHGRGLDPDALQTAYSRYLSVVRYAPRVPDIGGAPLPPAQISADNRGAKAKREPWFDVETSEDGYLLVLFSEDIAHEDPGAIDECVEASSEFSWISSAAHEDREVLRLEVREHSAKDLRDLTDRLTSILRDRRRDLQR